MTEGVEPSAEDSTPSAYPPRAAGSGRRLRRRRRWLIGALAVLAAVAVLHGLVLETFTVPSGSMQPTLWRGDRILVDKVHAHDVARDDVIVFDATDVFTHPGDVPPSGLAGLLRSVGDVLGIHLGETLYVKRVIGLPGDTVAVGHDGRLRINGTVRAEPFLAKGMTASNEPFSVRVPAGHVFVMGDNRVASDDSRSHLGDPGGGMVPVDDIVGKVVLRYWPLGSWGRLPT
ncbi:signal peptidase I [Flexivirga oryzae]|uniref:Signal peptidase I n=1 Tax=Flexivirga oryzae TaxID=1794944 RepID=A0A839NCY1_9MICO|nr:signal peptidase I [Flexivirga oryzae]MBB2892412.1 signal peptidase I [Flexivirga oryzae]